MYFSSRAFKHIFGKTIEYSNISTSKTNSHAFNLKFYKYKHENTKSESQNKPYEKLLKEAAKQTNRKWTNIDNAAPGDIVHFFSNKTQSSGLPILRFGITDFDDLEDELAVERKKLIQSLKTNGSRIVPDFFWFYLCKFDQVYIKKNRFFRRKSSNNKANMLITGFGSLDNVEHYDKYSLERNKTNYSHEILYMQAFHEAYPNSFPSDPSNLVEIMKDIYGAPRNEYDLEMKKFDARSLSHIGNDIADRIFGEENAYKPILDSRIGYYKGATEVWAIVSNRDEDGLIVRPIYVKEIGTINENHE